MTHTTEAQKRALLKLVYPKLVSQAKKNLAKIKTRIPFKQPGLSVPISLIEIGLASQSWKVITIGKTEHHFRILKPSKEGKQIAKEYCQKLLRETKAKNLDTKSQAV